ncbi:MAG TPA: hypothetical protein VK786_03035, partial [bacterium]|nr:hypothetical protein [bacterium]
MDFKVGKRAAGLLVGLCAAWPAWAGATRIGVDSARFSMAYLSNNQTDWAWAAGMEQILRYSGVDIKQEEIARRFYGDNLDGSTRTNDVSTGSDTINRCMQDWTQDDEGRPFTAKLVDWKMAPTAQVLLAELSAQRPMLAFMKLPDWDQYITGAPNVVLVHPVIIEAGDYAPEADGTPRFKTMEVRDPYITRKNPANPGFLELTPLEVKTRIIEYWTISVRATPSAAASAIPVVESPYRLPADDGLILARGWMWPESGVSGYNLYMSDDPRASFVK